MKKRLEYRYYSVRMAIVFLIAIAVGLVLSVISKLSFGDLVQGITVELFGAIFTAVLIVEFERAYSKLTDSLVEKEVAFQVQRQLQLLGREDETEWIDLAMSTLEDYKNATTRAEKTALKQRGKKLIDEALTSEDLHEDEYVQAVINLLKIRFDSDLGESY